LRPVATMDGSALGGLVNLAPGADFDEIDLQPTLRRSSSNKAPSGVPSPMHSPLGAVMRAAASSMPRSCSQTELNHPKPRSSPMIRVCSENSFDSLSDEETTPNARLRESSFDCETDEEDDTRRTSFTGRVFVGKKLDADKPEEPPEAIWKSRLKKSSSGEIWKRLLARGRGSAANVWTPLHQQIFLVCEVMVVSHNKLVLDLMKKVMEGVGHCKTISSTSTEEALETCRLRHYLPDILCLDEGAAHTQKCLEEIFSEGTDINVILLVTRDSLPTEEQLEGVHDYACIDDVPFIIAERVRGQVNRKRCELMQFDAQASKKLLESVFPSHVADQLKRRKSLNNSTHNGRRILQNHEQVTVLFSDIVDYTDVSASASTDEIVSLLDEMFTAFDALCEKHAVRKVETIGDAYMVVCGDDGSRDHAEKVLAMSMDMLQTVKKIKLPRSDEHVKIRLGIHSGPVSSGVVGRKCPRYCYFGDTVNTASRMESHGFPMAVHISDVTHGHIAHLGEKGSGLYSFHSCGFSQIKGKGQMQTWVVADRDVQSDLAEIRSYQAFRRTASI